MGRKRAVERVWGPSQRKDGRWIVTHATKGERKQTSFSSESEAREFAKGLLEELHEESITAYSALEKYELHKKSIGHRDKSVAVIICQIRHFLTDVQTNLISTKYLVSRVKNRLAEPIKPRFKEAPKEPSPPKFPTTDTVASELRNVKTFLRWCLSMGYVHPSLISRLDSVKVIGKRSKGKDQLSLDEAKKFIAAASIYAEKGERGAIVASCPLLLGIRSREILDRQVRDLDADGNILWIQRAKTQRGNRRVLVPEPLREWLMKLAEGRAGAELLIQPRAGNAPSTGWLNKWVKRICLEAGVPVVCAHGLRGTFATIAEYQGVASAMVADALGHTSSNTTGAHYTQPEIRDAAKQQRAFDLLIGGKAG